MLAGFVLVIPLVALWEHGPRAFWTGFLPLLPIGIVLMGFHRWRRLCPLAAISALGKIVPREKQRRVGAFFERWSYLVSLGVLAACLALRMLLVNGDGVALAAMLAGFALLAFVVGAVFTGKSWCNFFCPLGVVEKIYTEPIGLRETENSQCERCTACKKHCPDIDAESHYWKELEHVARRAAYYAFPGLVWGFYTAFALPRGTLEDYFSGAWTRAEPGVSLFRASGLWFAAVPGAITVPVHLGLSMAVSLGLFAGLERALSARIGRARALHVTPSVAAFVAFVSFYVFAGQPTFRRVPGLSLAVPLAAAVVAALGLARRFPRDEEEHVMGRTVKKLLAKWPYPDPPPRDPREVVFLVKNREKEQGRVLALYEDAMREVLADGVISASERRILDRMREDFGISRADHDALERRLRAELRATAEPGAGSSVERRLQLDGYRAALHALLVARAPDGEIERLRASYGVSSTAHASVLAELRADGSSLHLSIKEAVEELARARRVMAEISALPRPDDHRLLYLVMQRRQVAAIARCLSYVALLFPDRRATVHGVGARLSAPEPATRREGLALLGELVPSLTAALGPAVLERQPAPSADGGAGLGESLTRLLDGAEPFSKAAALASAAEGWPDLVRPRLGAAAAHAHPLVREVAGIAEGRLAGSPSLPPPSGEHADFATLPTPERMLVLGQIPLFADLEVEHLFDIALLATQRGFEPGVELCREGESGDEVFLLVAGAADVLRGGAKVGEVKAGDCVGELAVLDEAPRSATLVATRAVSALVIEGSAFRELARRDPELSAALLGMMARRLRSMLSRPA